MKPYFLLLVATVQLTLPVMVCADPLDEVEAASQQWVHNLTRVIQAT